ncbi:MAG: sensor histidine kinase [Segetibacter sp.]|nr:sensor histidine kinase [Segetibacter sp.]
MRYFKRSEVQIPLTFMVIGILWIVFSDQFFLSLQKKLSLSEFTYIQTVKGSFFVLSVTVLIHLMTKSANKKLIQSQEEYKDLFYYTPNPMLIFNLQTEKFFDVNKAALETYGYSAQEFNEMSLNDVRSDTSEKYRVLRDGTGNMYEHKKKNNDIIICQENKREIIYKNIASCLLSTHDITELQKAKTEITQRENQLKTILNSITDGFFIISNAFTIEKANEQFEKLVQVPVEEVTGKKIYDLFPGFKSSLPYRQYMLAIETQTTIHFENFDKRTNSWYRISAYPYESGLSVFFRDITNEKEAEIQIAQNQQKLLALINNTEDFIWSIDNNFRYSIYNEPYQKAYCQLFREDLWIGKVALNEQQGSEHVKKWKTLYERALQGEKFSIDMDLVIENSCHFTTVRFNPIYSADKKVIGVGCFLHNITERKLHEKKIEQQNEQLKQIAFITSHQVRVPLANILGLVNVLDKEDPLSAANLTIIEHIKTSAEQLDKTIINMVKQTAQFK